MWHRMTPSLYLGPIGKPADGLPTRPRWKRHLRMYVIPVCLAMVWQLAVIIGCLAVFLMGLTLLKLLWL